MQPKTIIITGASDGIGRVGAGELSRLGHSVLVVGRSPEKTARVAADSPLPQEKEGEIVGRADDGKGVEAMIVRISGTTDRPDGSTYHVTWSLADGRRAKESNNMLAAQKWVMFDAPIPIRLEPAAFT